MNILDIYNKVNHFGELNDMTFESTEAGKVTYKIKLSQKHESSPGIIHGGALAGFMDGVLGVSALSYSQTLGMLTSTVEMKLNFLKPLRTGDELTGYGVVEHTGKRILVSTGKVFNQNGEMVALGQGTFNCYPVDKSPAADKFMGL